MAGSEESERRVKLAMKSELKDHLRFNEMIWAFVVRTLGVFSFKDPVAVPAPRKVCAVLMARLANDLRCVSLLSGSGYPEQAAVIAASVLEVAYTIAYIRDDDDRAHAWIKHDDPTKSFKPVKQLIRDSVKLLGVENIEKIVCSERRIYSQLCWPKHANPITLQFRPIAEWSKHGALYLGPDDTEFSIRTAWFALQHSGKHAMFAVDVFHDTHFATLDVAAALGEARDLYDQLNARAKERWGTEDPFKGQW